MNCSCKMLDIVKDISSIWTRLLDHRAFLNGEIRFVLNQFEQARTDKEVENLFSLLENITDIKGTLSDKVKQSIDAVMPEANSTLSKGLSICDQISDLELKYKEDTTLELRKEDRKLEWEKFVDDMAYQCKRTDATFEEKEEEFQQFYRDLERKLHLTSAFQ